MIRAFTVAVYGGGVSHFSSWRSHHVYRWFHCGSWSSYYRVDSWRFTNPVVPGPIR